jgi:hypothetical protein
MDLLAEAALMPSGGLPQGDRVPDRIEDIGRV